MTSPADTKPPAPIALFVYNRLSHARRTLEALRGNSLAGDSELFIFSDGPKRESDSGKVRELRASLRDTAGFKKVTLVEREANMGLADSIIAGVSQLVKSHGRVIILEDDMVTSPFFLAYMNEALELYKDDDEVISVAAYIYPVSSPLPETFFIRGADCWGWGTWERGWKHFDPDGSALLARLEAGKMTRAFDMDGSYPYTRMLRNQIRGKNDSWAVRWYASAFLLDKLTLYPGTSLLHNIGNDGKGTHSPKTTVYDVKVAETPLNVERLPIRENAAARKAIRDHFRSTRNSPSGLLKRILGKLGRL